jgi:hypothetical protein
VSKKWNGYANLTYHIVNLDNVSNATSRQNDYGDSTRIAHVEEANPDAMRLSKKDSAINRAIKQLSAVGELLKNLLMKLNRDLYRDDRRPGQQQ